MNRREFQQLAEKIAEGTASEQDILLYNTWFQTFTQGEEDHKVSDDKEVLLLQRIQHQINPPRKIWPRIAAAASVLLALGVGTYYYTHQARPPVQLAMVDPLPMNKGVVLTMGGGKTLVLNNAHKGAIQTADGAKASQSDEALTYAQNANLEPVIHTLTNNTGSKYSLTLADGTEVFLDAASSVTYPVAFKGKERKISVTGQVYLKVKHDVAMPFRVTVADETIEDIGTEFNINAYNDEAALKTTLVEGAIKVSRKQSMLLLKPGEQTVSEAEGLSTRTADLESVTAWTQGKLIFNHEPLETILNQVARIYDVKFIWQDASLKQLKFFGGVSRTKKLNSILNFFRKTGKVDFITEGKTITVIKGKK